ncbi:TRAM domain-containing protein [Natronocalculus amylovorans]|uniref:TRAM domain-containing protein n=1 Tax=Natronocalculus amylovorans TaxID=2917812 RepID=A0AAE3K9X9_9EURY|nr:TRAM domain-containing protein [Natronocalculus amylovorans]MCL9818516.1 TRAM domain-containing protein [Natronocalculus amylovorans]
MDVSDDLLCLYTATTKRDGDRVILEIPEREVSLGTVDEGETVRVALISDISTPETTTESPQEHQPAPDEPPVSEGEIHRVEIESIGEQGDGIAKVDRGYVLVIPDGEPGDQLTVRVDTVTPTVGFAEIVSGQE